MNNRKLNVTVMLGGPSSEREVSLRSGAAVAKALRSLGHNVHELDPKEPSWILPPDTDIVPYSPLRSQYGHRHKREATSGRGHRRVLRVFH